MSEQILTPNLITSIIVIAIAMVILLLTNKIISVIMKHTAISDSMASKRLFTNIGRIIKVVVVVATVFTVFEINGINLTSLIASLGLVGAAATLAAQDFMKDVIAGIYISGEKMFQPGDYVEYKNQDGMVVDFNFRSTKIRLVVDDSIMYISNRNISEIIVLSRTNYIDLPMPYELDIRDAEKILDKVVANVTNDEKVDKIEYLGVQSLDDSSISYRILFNCEPIVRGILARRIRREFLLEMSYFGQSVPYNKLEVINNSKQ